MNLYGLNSKFLITRNLNYLVRITSPLTKKVSVPHDSNLSIKELQLNRTFYHPANFSEYHNALNF